VRSLLLVLVLASSGCPGTRTTANDPVNLVHDGWACFDYVANRSHCELITSNCESARTSVPADYQAQACRRVEKAWCFQLPGDQPFNPHAADPPMHHEGQEHMWCYTNPEECGRYSTVCVAPP
jgi:hypothetical protein